MGIDDAEVSDLVILHSVCSLLSLIQLPSLILSPRKPSALLAAVTSFGAGGA